MIDIEYLKLYTNPMTPNRITSIREQHGLTIAALARLFGVSWVTVQSWETGKHQPHQTYIRLLTQLEQLQPEHNGKD